MPINKNKLGALIVTAAIMGLSLPASADVIGVTVTTTANAPLDTWVDTVTVVAGVEMSAGDGSNHANTNQGQIFPHLFSTGDSYDFSGTSITINFAALGASFGFPYAFNSAFSAIVWDVFGTTLQSVTIAAGATGLSASNISNIVNDGFVFQATVDLVTGANFTLDLTFLEPDPDPDPDPDPTPIPEPATLPLLLVGLLGLIACRRRRLV
jgi:hypothetical protein